MKEYKRNERERERMRPLLLAAILQQRKAIGADPAGASVLVTTGRADCILTERSGERRYHLRIPPGWMRKVYGKGIALAVDGAVVLDAAAIDTPLAPEAWDVIAATVAPWQQRMVGCRLVRIAGFTATGSSLQAAAELCRERIVRRLTGTDE